MRNSLWQAYLWQDYDKLARSGHLHPQILSALHLHWSTQLANAYAAYEQILQNVPKFNLSEYERALVAVEIELLSAKLGMPLFDQAPQCSHWVPQLFRAYARFTHFFWIDHELAWKHLWHFMYYALRGRSSVLICALFLFGHMRCIQGKRVVGSVVSGLMWKLCMRFKTRSIRLPPVATGIVFAGYPYTMFVLGRSLAVRSYVEKYGHLVSRDPFYQTVFQISCFYAFAYSGDVVRTEMFASRFKLLHSNDKLLRYRPVTGLLPMLPMALRGYGFVVQQKFNRIVNAHDEYATDVVVNFQFYHAAAIIELSMMHHDAARKHIEKAIFYREKSGSFQAWADVDERILELAISKAPFDPQKSRLLGTDLHFDSAHGLSQFFLQLTAELPRFASNPDSFVRYIVDYLQLHLGDCKLEVVSSISAMDILEKIYVVAMQKYIVINADKERLASVSAMVETISPAIVAVETTISEMQSLHKDLEESSKLAAIARTTQTIAHDVRRPFAQLKMGLEVLKSEPLAASTAAFVSHLSDKVDRSYQQVNAMLDDILHIGRRYDLEHSTVDLQSTLEEVVQNVCEDLRIPASRWRATFDADLFVHGDELHLRRVWTNLIVNAVEAMGAEGELSVAARRRSLDDGDMIEVVIQNTHSYVAPEEQEKIFEPFYTKGKHSGTGLGLAIAKQILQAHGARIDCRSHEQIGTQFVVAFIACSDEAAKSGLGPAVHMQHAGGLVSAASSTSTMVK